MKPLTYDDYERALLLRESGECPEELEAQLALTLQEHPEWEDLSTWSTQFTSDAQAALTAPPLAELDRARILHAAEQIRGAPVPSKPRMALAVAAVFCVGLGLLALRQPATDSAPVQKPPAGAVTTVGHSFIEDTVLDSLTALEAELDLMAEQSPETWLTMSMEDEFDALASELMGAAQSI